MGNFPQLRLLAWNRRPTDTITGEEAFGLYENNWRFVDEEHLDPQERMLIDQLTRAYGHGLMNV
ncbi:hypothetical protein C7C56_020145 [Massilia glaciei]|uniref:Uncharacterized protein n=1 Tax=Massilia glaciei TaxID=1524097 RepID=A0A2U2HGD0_9BURK|nr:hypothetical protein C7C56_020145 [Massilia glaciei]